MNIVIHLYRNVLFNSVHLYNYIVTENGVSIVKEIS